MMRYGSFTIILTFMVILPSLCFAQSLKADNQAAHIFVYTQIGEENDAAAVTHAQFENHLNILKARGFKIIPLQTLIEAYENNSPLPDKTAIITFDGGHKSVVTLAQPTLERYGYPFTVFINPETDDPQFLSHKDIIKMDRSPLVKFGLMAQKPTSNSDSANQALQKQLNNNTERFYNLLQYRPQWLSFQDGLYHQEDLAITKRYGFKAMVGQKFGVANNGHLKNVLPRFSMTRNLSQPEQFNSILNARSFPIKDMTPVATIIDTPTPSIGFTLAENIKNIDQLICYADGQKKPEVTVLGNRVEMRLASPINNLLLRVNCVLPIEDAQSPKTPYYRWFGTLLSFDENIGDANKTH